MNGSLEVGKNADLVILDKAPLVTPEIEINNIEIMKSIKKGATIYNNN